MGYRGVLFGFFAAGIASVLYEVLLGKHFSKRSDRRHHWPLICLSSGLLFTLIFIHTLSIGILSIYSSAFLLILAGSTALFFRHDLVADALVSGITFASLSAFGFVIYTILFPTVVEAWWNTGELLVIPFVKYPAEEIMWAFAFGFAAGPMYEFLAGKKF